VEENAAFMRGKAAEAEVMDRPLPCDECLEPRTGDCEQYCESLAQWRREPKRIANDDEGDEEEENHA
jgi:hypothetical protein